MQRVLILGAGGHAQQVADVLLCAHEGDSDILPVGYLDDNPALQGQHFLELPVLGRLNDRLNIAHDAIIVGIGNNRIRQSLFEQARRDGECFAIACHPSAVIARDVVIGGGTLIAAHVVISPGTVIGENVILNSAATVGHHSHIGSHVHLGPGVHTGGEVRVGDGGFVGIGGIIMPQRRVGNESIVGAGTLVHDDVPDGAVVVGVPGRILKRTGER
ncbi:MAG: acetyltransferase [Herpetosiphonaceae bacterium]|nr:acetyltransferase [Herpetosiphonaceae bacterium]